MIQQVLSFFIIYFVHCGDTSGNGQAWSLAGPRGQWRTGKNGENWLQNHLRCPNDPHGLGIDDDDDDKVTWTAGVETEF